jgi:DHA1 family bicyclomycin/chloramphenicol resistance-like MFS transporter
MPAAPASLLWLITGCLMLQPLSTDLYLASLPAMAESFGVAPAVVQQTLTQFVLGFGAAQLFSGPLSDRFGRRPVLLGGLAAYLAATTVCAFAPDIGTLVGGRFLQAIGCCSCVVVARAIVRDAWTPAEGGPIVARASSWMALAPLLGPIAGGYLQVAFGWQAAFAVHALAALVVLAMVLPFRETNLRPNPDALRPTAFAAGYAIILRSATFWSYALPGALSYCSIFVFISGSSFVLIKVLGVPTQYFGFCFAFGVSGFLAGTLVCRRLMLRLGLPRTLRLGALLSLLVPLGFALAIAAGMAHWTVFVLAQCLVMFAHGINFPCTQTGAVAPFAERAGAAAGLLGFIAMLAAFATGTLVGASHDGTVTPLATISATVGVLLFAAERLLARVRPAL